MAPISMSYALPIAGTVSEPQEIFSDFSLTPYISTANPAHGIKDWNEGIDRQTFDMNTWQADPKNKVFFQNAPLDYADKMIKQDEFIREFFDYEETDVEIHITQRVNFGKELAPALARGTLIPFITSSKESSITRNDYHHQGFKLNWFTLDKKEGREDMNRKMKHVVWNVQRSHLNTVVNAFFVTPQAARYAHQKNGEFQLPKNPLDLFLIQQKQHGCCNKNVNAIYDIVRNSNNVFSQFERDLETTHVFMSYADNFYIEKYNDLVNRADSSGNPAASSKRSIEVRRDFGSFVAVNIPFIEKNIHDKLNHTFTRPYCTGSNVNFDNKTVNLIAGYKTWMRNVYYADIASGGYSEYPFIDHLHAWSIFFPTTDDTDENTGEPARWTGFGFGRKRMSAHRERKYDENGDCVDGHLNYDFINKYLLDNSARGSDWMSRTGALLYGNENFISEAANAMDMTYASFLKGNGSKTTNVWYPLIFMGQTHEDRCRYAYYYQSHRSMAYSMYADLTDKEKTCWNTYLQMALDDSNEFVTQFSAANFEVKLPAEFITAVHKVMMRMEAITDDSPLFGNYIDASAKFVAGGTGAVTYKTYEYVSTAANNPYPKGAMRRFMNAVLFINKQKEAYQIYTKADLDGKGLSHITPAPRANLFEETMAAANEIRTRPNPSGPWWFKMMKKYPLITPELRNGRISTFIFRFFETFKYEPELLFAAQVNLWSSFTLQTIDKRGRENVHITLGGMNVRREYQEMHNIVTVALGKGSRSKLGKFYKGPSDSVSNFEPIKREHDYQMGFSHGVGIINTDQFFWQQRVRGGRYIGGSDRFYAPERMLLENSRGNYSHFQQRQMEKGSNIAVPASYNQSIEGPVLSSFDMCGFFSLAQLGNQVADGEWSSVTQKRPPAEGLCMLNYIHKFNEKRDSKFDGLDTSKLNFNEEAMLGETTTIVRKLNSLVYNPTIGKWEETVSEHEWGVMGDNVSAYVTSASNVTQEEVDVKATDMRKRAKLDSYN